MAEGQQHNGRTEGRGRVCHRKANRSQSTWGYPGHGEDLGIFWNAWGTH